MPAREKQSFTAWCGETTGRPTSSWDAMPPGSATFTERNEARLLFERLAEDMGLLPLTFDKIGYCPKCLGMASLRSCPHQSAWFSMLGTRVRDLLSQGERPPVEIMRPEIADILVEGYRPQEGYRHVIMGDATPIPHCPSAMGRVGPARVPR